MSDELIEAMARIIDPRAWAESARSIGRADDWALRGKPGGVDFEKMYRSQAVEAVSDSLSRARAILPVIRAHLEPNERLINVGVGAILTSKERPAIISQHDALAIAFPAMLAASPIGDVG